MPPMICSALLRSVRATIIFWVNYQTRSVFDLCGQTRSVFDLACSNPVGFNIHIIVIGLPPSCSYLILSYRPVTLLNLLYNCVHVRLLCASDPHMPQWRAFLALPARPPCPSPALRKRLLRGAPRCVTTGGGKVRPSSTRFTMGGKWMGSKLYVLPTLLVR